MFKFNNSHIFTGYLKQLLATVKLPKYKVYSNKQQLYFNEFGTEYNVISSYIDSTGKKHIVPYIRNNALQYYLNNSWVTLNSTFLVDNTSPNEYKKLEIQNSLYDNYTHEYLGDYLRFQRDYYGLDLMPLYNCFNNKLCQNLYLEFKAKNNKSIIFNTADSKYKIYAVPVKMLNEYTIAIDSGFPVEVCCGIYGSYLVEDTEVAQFKQLFDNLSTETYMKFNNTRFNQPVLYNKLMFNNLATSISAQEFKVALSRYENYLTLFVKIPATNNSSITILEGNYLRWNDSLFFADNLKRSTNMYITNFEYDAAIELFKPITILQLLKMNTHESYPFADALVGYLTDNTITQNDQIADNIKRVESVIELNKHKKFKWYGLWSNKIRPIIYNFMHMNYDRDLLNNDVLGYVDANAEKLYNCELTNSEGKKVTRTISNIDIYGGDINGR